jgi:hypothetical protein
VKNKLSYVKEFSCCKDADDVPEVFLPDGKFNVRAIHWLPSYIADQLVYNRIREFLTDGKRGAI